ncbi:frizzled [Elysia marginata]|uniref:Frizzled n=1 Tax=Elysia marginata TaxID=1093978 RepID=A0AAV4H845_9GAST|nr:frizzled [Elysia marginata]
MALSYLALLCISLTLIPSIEGACKKLKLDACQHMGYTMVHYPNTLGHKNEEEALEALKQTGVLANAACDDKIPIFRQFLCHLYFPPCTVLPKAIAPCRSACEDVANRCSASLNAKGIPWEQEWSCNKFDTVCLLESSETNIPNITINFMDSTRKAKPEGRKSGRPEVTVPRGPRGPRRRGGRPSVQKCETFRSANCPNLPYDHIGFPNLLNQRSPQEADAVLQTFVPVLRSGCSSILRDFMCSVHFPQCQDMQIIPPCKSLCIEAFMACIGEINEHGFRWPGNLRCDRFPENDACYGKDLVGQAKSLQSATTPKPSSKVSPTAPSGVDIRPGTGDIGPFFGKFMGPVLEWLQSSTNLNKERSKLTMEEVKLAVLNQQKLDLEINKMKED